MFFEIHCSLAALFHTDLEIIYYLNGVFYTVYLKKVTGYVALTIAQL